MSRLASRLLMVALLVAPLVGAIPGTAAACSCAAPDPARMLADADAAFVGMLTGPPVPGAGIDGKWPFAVEQWVKGDLGATIDVSAPLDGAACGFEIAEGARVGVVLYRHHGTLSGGLCGTVNADVLLAAAVPPGPPDGEGPIAFLVAGPAGPYRVVALDAQGRVLARADGEGDVHTLAVCPGERYAAELAAGSALAVRDLETFAIVWQRALPGAGRWYSALQCRDPGGSLVWAFGSDHSGEPVRSTVIAATAGGAEVLATGEWDAGVFTGDRLVAAVTGRPELRLVDLTAGTDEPLFRLVTESPFTGVQGLAVSPGGGKAAFSTYEFVEDADRSQFHVVDLATGDAASLPGTAGAMWLDEETLLADGGPVKVLYRVADAELRQLGVRGWSFAPQAAAGAVVYGWDWPGGAIRAAALDGEDVETLRVLPTTATHALVALAAGPEPDPAPSAPATTVPPATVTTTSTLATPPTVPAAAPASDDAGGRSRWPVFGGAGIAAALALAAWGWRRRT